MKQLFHIPIMFNVILYRQILYRVKKRDLKFNNASIDAPIGIIGQPNKITWNVDNFVFAKISNGKKNTIVTNNEYRFINTSSFQQLHILFYGIKKKYVKTFDPYFLEVHKNPPPEPHYKKENGLILESEFSTKTIFPFLKPSFTISPSYIKISLNVPITTDLKVFIPPMDLSELAEEILHTDNEQDINILTKTIKNEKRLLPQPDPRPYHEVIMESRWFG